MMKERPASLDVMLPWCGTAKEVVFLASNKMLGMCCFREVKLMFPSHQSCYLSALSVGESSIPNRMHLRDLPPLGLGKPMLVDLEGRRIPLPLPSFFLLPYVRSMCLIFLIFFWVRRANQSICLRECDVSSRKLHVSPTPEKQSCGTIRTWRCVTFASAGSISVLWPARLNRKPRTPGSDLPGP